MHFEHKSCAVKLHAYTLDSSCNLASALQQNMPFPQPPRNCSVFAVQHDKGFAPANRCCATSTANRPSLSKCPNQSGLQPSLSRPDAGFVPARADRNNIGRSAGKTWFFGGG